jgi:2'-hydroxyisoflavone reductase
MLFARRPESQLAGAARPCASAPGLEVSPGHLFQHVDVEGLAGHYPLEALVLLLELLEPLGVLALHTAVLVVPAVPGGRGDFQVARYLGHFLAFGQELLALGYLAYDLLGGVMASLHVAAYLPQSWGVGLSQRVDHYRGVRSARRRMSVPNIYGCDSYLWLGRQSTIDTVRFLVLGGTSFVGRAIVEAAVSKGHDVILFNRGLTGLGLFDHLERRIGDRDTGDYETLVGQSWHCVIDVSAYLPRHVRELATALHRADFAYVFISTGSVYDHGRIKGVTTERSPRLAPETHSETITPASYGRLKVACEDEVLARFTDRAAIVRPGLVAGPHDPTDRFTYWVRRAALGGQLALPGRSDQPAQVIDARDLADFVVGLSETGTTGPFNAVGPAEPITFRDLIHTCSSAAGASIEIVEVDSALVEANFPLVLPDSTWHPMYRRSAALARRHGLTYRSLATTATDVLAWDLRRGQPALKIGISLEREQEILRITRGKSDNSVLN